MDVGAVKAPTIQRSYPCKRLRQSVSTSPSRSFRFMALRRAGGYSPSVEASPGPGVLPETTAVPDWHRGLRLVSLLVARTSGTWTYCAIDAASLREALRQTAEERCS